MSPSLYATVGIHLFQMSSIFYAMCVGVREGRLSRLDSIGFYILLHFGFGTHILGLIGEVSATEFVVKEVSLIYSISALFENLNREAARIHRNSVKT